MAIGAGIGGSFGIATETTFNTGVTVSRFYEFNSESVGYEKNMVQGEGLRAGGQLPRSQRNVVTTFSATGDVEIDLPTRGLGLLLSHCMGTAPTPTNPSAGVYNYSFTLGDVYGRSFTTQVGAPQYGGTVTPKTATGCKIANFEIGVSNAAIGTLKATIDGAGFTTATALATPSYPLSGSVFHFAQAAITVDGSPVANIRDFTLSVDNNLKVDRYNLGSAGAKAEQGFNGFRAITGTVTAEFTDTTLYTKFLNNTTTGLALTFTGDTIASTYKDTLSITCPAVKFDGENPNVSGPGTIDVSFSFVVLDNGTDAPLTIVYQSADSAL